MKKFFLIVNTTVLLLMFLLFFFLIKIQAQSPSITPSMNQKSSSSFRRLMELIYILTSYRDIPPPPTSPPNQPPQTSITPPNTTLTPLPPLPPGDMGSILQWTIEINNRLEAATNVWPPWPYYHKLLNPPSNGSYTAAYAPATSLSNLYWCTYLVADAYNLAGKSGLSRSSHATVKNMQQFFISTAGYKYISYSVRFLNYYANPPTYQVTSGAERKQTLGTVIPGCATFFQKEAGVHVPYGNHVAILKSKSIDSSYNGFIETYDSNNTSKILRYPVYQGNIQNTPFIQDSLRGFGCL